MLRWKHKVGLFCRGHQAYLQSAPTYNFPMYRQLVHEITQTFKKISDEIIDIENKLRAQHNLPEVAKFIAKVQEEEKLKLETVTHYRDWAPAHS